MIWKNLVNSKRKIKPSIPDLKIKPLFGILKFLAFSLLILGCSNPKPSQQGIVYIPPTPAATSIPPTITPSPQKVIASSPTPPCTNNLLFLRDISIEDGSIVTPDQLLDKRWEIQNTGTCNWDNRYQLRLIDGSDLGAGEAQALFPTRSSTIAENRILFSAPQDTGIYRSAWQAFDPQDQPFGDPIYIEVVVEAASSDDN